MSRLPLRKDLTCLNCNTAVVGRYCHQCGQENTEPQETVLNLIQHFIYDILHFDGKFFVSLKFLLFRPGFLTEEYRKGKRASYLNPIRMYLFTSALFFIILKSLPSSDTDIKTNIQLNQNDIQSMNQAQYDSLQQTLPPAERDGKFFRWMNKKVFGAFEKYKGRENEMLEKMEDSFIQSLPTWMLITLPLFSFILSVLYFRHQTLFLVDHLIFTLHLYIAQYIQTMVLLLLTTLYDLLKWEILDWLIYILFGMILIYMYKALRNFYKQSRIKTLFKFILLLFSMIIIASLLFLGLGIQSILSV